MRLAHLSDLHLLSLDDLTLKRILNKRLTGYVNIKLKRGSIHRPAAARALAHKLAEHDVDHVVITGDVSNLALPSEFALVRRFVQQDIGLPADRISMVPGNHDTYTRGAYAEQRFERSFAEYMSSDLPGASGVPGLGRYPYVQLRGPIAIIGLSSAVPRAPIVAAGELGHAQRAALHSLLSHREVRARTPVILQHHPWHNPPSRRKTFMNGLRDAAKVRDTLQDLSRGLLLHGHLHRRIRHTLPTRSGELFAVGATSASLVHDDPDRMSGFNLYDIDDDGRIADLRAFRLDKSLQRVQQTPLPLAS